MFLWGVVLIDCDRLLGINRALGRRSCKSAAMEWNAPLHSTLFASKAKVVAKGHAMKSQIEGSHNPFVRTSWLPPLHINLNYAISTLRSLPRRLYDEHLPRIYPNRAHPMVFDGVSQFPFDLNDSPVPVAEQRPHSVLQMFKSIFDSSD